MDSSEAQKRSTFFYFFRLGVLEVIFIFFLLFLIFFLLNYVGILQLGKILPWLPSLSSQPSSTSIQNINSHSTYPLPLILSGDEKVMYNFLAKTIQQVYLPSSDSQHIHYRSSTQSNDSTITWVPALSLQNYSFLGKIKIENHNNQVVSIILSTKDNFTPTNSANLTSIANKYFIGNISFTWSCTSKSGCVTESEDKNGKTKIIISSNPLVPKTYILYCFVSKNDSLYNKNYCLL